MCVSSVSVTTCMMWCTFFKCKFAPAKWNENFKIWNQWNGGQWPAAAAKCLVVRSNQVPLSCNQTPALNTPVKVYIDQTRPNHPMRGAIVLQPDACFELYFSF